MNGINNNRMLQILNNLSESTQLPVQDVNEGVEASNETICPVCGARWTPEVTVEGAEAVCPLCSSPLANTDQAGAGDAQVEAEPETTEVVDEDEAKLESVFQTYLELVESQKFDEAKSLLEAEEVSAICESEGILLEKFVIKVVDGKKVKKTVRTKPVKKDAAYRARVKNLKKARKKSHTGSAARARKKSMKARVRMGINESIRKTQIVNAIQGLAESYGFSMSAKALEKAVNEAYHINESEVLLPEDKVSGSIHNVFNNLGLEVKDITVEVIDGVLVAHAEIQDNDTEVYLGDVADELQSLLGGYDVDYDEPEEDEEDESLVYVDFYFIPVIASESAAVPTVEDEPTVDLDDEDDKEDEDELEECDKKKVNESVGVAPKFNELFESYAGGVSNVRCKLLPAYIKAGQIIYDADDQTLFKALTESVATEDGFSLGVEILNSTKQGLADLVPGSEVTLASKGSYFLLKENPM